MSTIRTTLILLLMLPLAGALAQATAKTETTTTAAADTATTTNATTTAQEAGEPRALSAYEVRNQFTRLLGDNPSEPRLRTKKSLAEKRTLGRREWMENPRRSKTPPQSGQKILAANRRPGLP